MPVPLFHVDAFTDHPFGGNPAGVCLLDGPAPEPWMASVAAEMNLSETAFAWRVEGAGERFGLRWWTPLTEVPLCGHATLATAHVLRVEERIVPGSAVTFDTASGDLTAETDGDVIELDFPAYDRRDLTAAEVAGLERVLGHEVAGAAGYGPKALVPLPDPAAVLAAAPDLAGLAGEPHEGLCVTAATDDGYVLRYFAPAVGIPEDPVTGSAQCAAGPYWAERTGRSELEAEQLSARRGWLRVRVGPGGRVRIAGSAVVVSSGSLAVDPL